MRVLFAMLLMGVVLAVAGCSPTTKAIDTQPPTSGPARATADHPGKPDK